MMLFLLDYGWFESEEKEMCRECWEEYGCPKIIGNNVLEAAEAGKRVYEFNGAGGSLHILLDDWNIEDTYIDYCRQHIEEKRSENSDAQYEAEVVCFEKFKGLTKLERASALALMRGYYTLDQGTSYAASNRG